MSGHSKFANIKHRKERQDSKRAVTFAKLLKKISIEAKKNNNLDTNYTLKTLVNAANKLNIPKKNIQSAIQKSKNLEDLDVFIYEGFLNSDVSYIIKVITNNNNRTSATIKNFFHKVGGNLGIINSVAHNYNHYQAIIVEENLISNTFLEEIILNTNLIDYKIIEEEYNFYYDFIQIQNGIDFFVQQKITNIEIKEIYLANYFINIELNNELHNKIQRFEELLKDNDDVVEFWNNYQIIIAKT